MFEIGVISGKLHHLTKCPSCKGTGESINSKKCCTLCNGSGKVYTLVEYDTFEEE